MILLYRCSPVIDRTQSDLKRYNQAKIIFKLVFLFRLLNMAIYKMHRHVHILELCKSLRFCVAHLAVNMVKREMRLKFIFRHVCPK